MACRAYACTPICISAPVSGSLSKGRVRSRPTVIFREVSGIWMLTASTFKMRLLTSDWPWIRSQLC